MPRHYSPADRLIFQVDQVLSTLAGGRKHSTRPSPAELLPEAELSDRERRHAAGLMRVNHTGEVCAQALYQGQALTAKLDSVRDRMQAAAQEEEDHLEWCEQRLAELDSRPSVLNPLFYGASLGLGALAGTISDKWSLGFVAATEDQVCRHLESHLQTLPSQDERSRAVVREMLKDESRHASQALADGGRRFPSWLKRAMSKASKVMTETTYRI
jgi:ubiquinone biosynthesis monooxygenase Coq7